MRFAYIVDQFRHIVLQILVATFAQLRTFRSALGYEYTEYASPVGTVRHPRAVSTRSANFTCTSPGRFPNSENCSQYYLCVQITPSQLYLSYMTCPNALVFDPSSQSCTTADNYTCPSTTTTTTTTQPPSVCTGPGFLCNNDTTYTLCADVGVPIVIKAVCPPGYFCNKKCLAPCIDYVPLC
jgi:hypothetical protein